MNILNKYFFITLLLLTLSPTNASSIDFENDNNTFPTSQQSLIPDDEPINESANALALHLATDVIYLVDMAAIHFLNSSELEGFLPPIQLIRATSLGYLNYCAWNEALSSPQSKVKLFLALVLVHTIGDIAFEFQDAVYTGLTYLVMLTQSVQEYVPVSVILAGLSARILINKFKKTGDIQKILRFWASVITQNNEYDKKRV